MNQREIKFRVFGKKSKKFHYFNLMDAQSGWVVPNEEVESYQQFTGLLDSNGKEIYESDICKNGDYEANVDAYNYRVEEVKWDKDNACWAGWNPNVDGMVCEVIGNVMENPELLS